MIIPWRIKIEKLNLWQYHLIIYVSRMPAKPLGYEAHDETSIFVPMPKQILMSLKTNTPKNI